MRIATVACFIWKLEKKKIVYPIRSEMRDKSLFVVDYSSDDIIGIVKRVEKRAR